MTTTTAFTVAQGKALMKSAGKRQHYNGETKRYESWDGWCAAFTYWFTGAAHSYDTATDAFMASTIVSKNAALAPAGAIHYWTNQGGSTRPGHVAVSLGNGVAAMASARVTTKWGDATGTIPVAAYVLQTKGFLTYEGWSYTYGEFRMKGVQTLAQVKAQTKATPKTYVVKSKDNLGSIAKHYGVTTTKIIALNRKKHPSLATNPDLIKVGWTLALK